MLEEQRSHQQIGARRERGTLDIILENLGLQLVPFQAFSKTCQERWIEVRTGKAVRTKKRRVQEIEHLPGPRSRDRNPAAGP